MIGLYSKTIALFRTATFQGVFTHLLMRLVEILRNWIGFYLPTLLNFAGRFRVKLSFALFRLRFRGVSWMNNPPVVFVHIPKCAGSSIRWALRKKMGDGLLEVRHVGDIAEWILANPKGAVPQALVLVHLPIQTLVDTGLINSDLSFREFVFTTIRDPEARFVSGYRDCYRKNQFNGSPSFETVLRRISTTPLRPETLFRRIPTVFLGPMTWYLKGLSLSDVQVYRSENLPSRITIRGIDISLEGVRKNPGSKSDGSVPPFYDRPLQPSETMLLQQVFRDDFALLAGHG